MGRRSLVTSISWTNFIQSIQRHLCIQRTNDEIIINRTHLKRKHMVKTQRRKYFPVTYTAWMKARPYDIRSPCALANPWFGIGWQQENLQTMNGTKSKQPQKLFVKPFSQVPLVPNPCIPGPIRKCCLANNNGLNSSHNKPCRIPNHAGIAYQQVVAGIPLLQVLPFTVIILVAKWPSSNQPTDQIKPPNQPNHQPTNHSNQTTIQPSNHSTNQVNQINQSK